MGGYCKVCLERIPWLTARQTTAVIMPGRSRIGQSQCQYPGITDQQGQQGQHALRLRHEKIVDTLGITWTPNHWNVCEIIRSLLSLLIKTIYIYIFMKPPSLLLPRCRRYPLATNAQDPQFDRVDASSTSLGLQPISISKTKVAVLQIQKIWIPFPPLIPVHYFYLFLLYRFI